MVVRAGKLYRRKRRGIRPEEIKVKSLKMPYSAGVHPIAIGKPVQKIGLPTP